MPSPAPKFRSHIEILEARVVPVVFVITGANLDLFRLSGGEFLEAVGDPVAAQAAGATRAVSLVAKDTLLFDGDGLASTTSDRLTLATLNAGRATIFLTDELGPDDLQFDPGEISGIAMGNGAKLSVQTDVNGTIATVLTAAGNFTPNTLQDASIAGLTVAGRVLGDILAGGSISNVTIGSGLYVALDDSVRSLRTGTATQPAADPAAFDPEPADYGARGDMISSQPSFEFNFDDGVTKAGGNISNVKLATGAGAVIAGVGEFNLLGKGGAGGSLTNVRLGQVYGSLIVSGGNGGPGIFLEQNGQIFGVGTGGAGGSIAGFSATVQGSLMDAVTVVSGLGGDSQSKAGGAGGGISGAKINVVTDIGQVFVLSGRGGAATERGAAGGAGGAITGSSISTIGSIGSLSPSGERMGGDFVIAAGRGGHGYIEDGQPPLAFGEANGGVGGTISATTVAAAGAGARLGALSVTAGDGGAGAFFPNSPARGGAGGSLLGVAVRATAFAGLAPVPEGGAQAPDRVQVNAGQGGSALRGGGAGGSLSGVTLDILGGGAAYAEVFMAAGRGGELPNLVGEPGAPQPASGVAGAGGSIRSSSVRVHDFRGGTRVGAGDGGSAAGTGTGGAGGAMSGLIFEGTGVLGAVQVTTGFGGFSGESGIGSNGGAGGAIVSSRVEVLGSAATVVVAAGTGAPGAGGAGKGGAGGAITGLSVTAAATESVLVRAGNAGAGPAGGGAGGSISASSFAGENVVENFGIVAGTGGAALPGSSLSAAGGAGGAIAGVTVRATQVGGDLFLVGGPGGDSRNTAAAAGGALSKVTAAIHGSAASLSLESGRGGTVLAGNGSGGAGGALNGAITNPGNTGAARMVTGNGGDGRGTGSGGASGALAAGAITVRGSLFQWAAATGDGGDGVAGGASGAITGFRFVSDTDVFSAGRVVTGVGGSGTRGGVSGAVSKLSYHSLAGQLYVNTGEGGGGVTAGGAAGSIGLSSTALGALDVAAGRGGAAPGGTGAAGGSIAGISVGAVGGQVHRIAAGDGGNGSVPGRGGSIASVVLAGDLGDFGAPFEVRNEVSTVAVPSQGGLIAGQGGANLGGGAPGQNGSISKVTAERIATIIAGRPTPNGATALNAVYSLTGIKARVIGADFLDSGAADPSGTGSGEFNFLDGNGDGNYTLGAGDTLLDGIVLARLAQDLAALPVRPLRGIAHL